MKPSDEIKRAFNVLSDLLSATELNLDEMEDKTRVAITDANGFIKELISTYGEGELEQ